MSQLQDLRARMRLDNAQFSRGLNQARGETQRFGAAMRSMIRSVAGPLAAAFSFRAIIQGARQGAAEIDNVAKSARALQGSIGGVRAVEVAMEEAGISASVMRQEIQNLNRQLANGGADTAMRALGLEADKLARMDVDEKMATIADRIQELGLDAGSTNAILQQFGIRNRDMALLVMQGGDAIRAARRDIEDYGLALSDVDASRIEAANDAIGRLSVVGQYLRQQLALAITPALGEFARMMTEAMREGGALRGIIDGMVQLVPRLSAYIATAAAGFLAYSGVLLGVAAAKWAIVAAANGLRAALMRLGLPILILAAGEMVFQFGRLVTATGGWGGALDALGDLAAGVWDGIKTSAKSIEPALGAVWQDVRAGFFNMMEALTRRWTDFLLTLSAGVSNIPGAESVAASIVGAAARSDAAMAGFTRSANEAAASADRLRAQAAQLGTAGFDRARAALGRLRDVIAETNGEGEEFAGSLREIYQTLDDIGDGSGGGGGGAADRAAAGVANLRQEMTPLEQAAQRVEQSFESAFVNIISGTQSARQAVAALLQDLARMAAQSAFQTAFGGSGLFSAIGSIFGVGANANGTDNWRGGLSWVGERGPELVNLPRGSQVFDAQKSARMAKGDSEPAQVVVRIQPSGEFDTRVQNTARAVVRVETPGMIGGAFKRARETRAFD